MIMIMVACLLLFFLLILEIQFAVAQPGFVNIQCCATSEFTDPQTNITYTSDDYLLNDVGICHNVSDSSISDIASASARIFGNDNRDRWCYDVPVVKGHDYLIRTTFLRGPFVKTTEESTFNVSIGTTSISRINSSLNFKEVEGIFAAIENHTNVCLLKGNGNAYISTIELRPLSDSVYLGGNSSYVLKLISRVDLGNKNSIQRYPTDPADRIWSIDSNSGRSNSLRSSDISVRGANSFIPIEVLKTAALDDEQLQFLHADLDMSSDEYLIILYFLELNPNVQMGQRVFDVYVNGDKIFKSLDILQNGSNSNYHQVSMTVKTKCHLNLSLVKVSGMKFGPICNAYEIFQVHQKAAETMQQDLNAVVKLREELAADNPENVMFEKLYGDPCMHPPWKGVACEEKNNAFFIIELDFSSVNLNGPLPTVIGDLTELKKLSINCSPNISCQIPHGSSNTKNLTEELRRYFSESPSHAQSPRRNIHVTGTVAGGSVVFSVALGVFFTCFYKCGRPSRKQHPSMKNVVFSESSIHKSSMTPTVKCFSLEHIERATCNYSTLIGEGGFGAVYRGTLPHDQEVAVKVRSATSTQGTREFDTEVTLLSSIQDDNLVPLLGYCCENDQQILVYPFMSNGSLQDRLYGEASKRKVLDWPTRLSIAHGAARGLMYLHTFAGRCIIHRDVKSSNILLDHSMCGKVADFGFSKYAPQEGDSGVSLEVRGTAGYLDPEYYSTQQLSTKSDVFSFGVVLLEIVTGREPLNVHRPRNEWSLVEWAKPFVRESRIEEIVDPNIKGGYHAEAMWRVVEVALACIEPFSDYRPNMEDIVRELEDAMIIENNASEYMRSIESFGGSNRFISIERRMLATSTSQRERCEIPAPMPR